MSKYNALWQFIKDKNEDTLKLTFQEIETIVGLPIDHSFLNFKKELLVYGHTVGKISLKEQTVIFTKTKPDLGM